jgi:lysozyme family protein
MSAFENAFAYTVGNEGSYSNDAHDSGGPTKFGITQHDLSVYFGRPASVQEVKDMGLDVAREIYEKRYWKPLACDQMPESIACCMFDIGVVRGIGVPPKYAQNICNNHGAHLAVDGHLGPLSVAAINEIEPAAFIRDFSAMAEAGFRAIVAARPSQHVFLKGWVNRARRLLTLIPH